jgi:WhiB family redox-sensing transcriptional regulator
MSWRDKAACDGADWTLFFSDSEGGDAFARMKPIAEEHCATCPVLMACAEHADAGREKGLWAGSYRTERVGPYRRERLIPQAPILPLPARRRGRTAKRNVA